MRAFTGVSATFAVTDSDSQSCEVSASDTIFTGLPSSENGDGQSSSEIEGELRECVNAGSGEGDRGLLGRRGSAVL